MPENKIPNPMQVAARVKPKPVPVKKGWHAVSVSHLETGDIVRMRLGGTGSSYRVDKIEGSDVRLSVYSTVGVGKVPPRTLAMSSTHAVWKWF